MIDGGINKISGELPTALCDLRVFSTYSHILPLLQVNFSASLQSTISTMNLSESRVQVFLQPHLLDPKPSSQVTNQGESNITPQTCGSNSAWDTLAKWLPYQNANSDWWWKTTGKHLQILLEDAGYNLSQQYETLMFHYWAIVPRLGPHPTSIHPRWKSFMTDDFSPIEYSWKWGMGSDLPRGSIQHRGSQLSFRRENGSFQSDTYR